MGRPLKSGESLSLLYLTYCSKEKKPVSRGSPEQIYKSEQICNFINICKSKGLSWAILSAKYDLFFPEEINDNYDVTFKTIAGKCRVIEDGRLLSKEESDRRINALTEKIRNKVNERKIESITFFVDKPIVRKKCYLFILHAAVDHCDIHKKWNEIVEHINNMYKDGEERIILVTSLDEI